MPTSATFSRGYFGELQSSSSTRPSEYHTFFNATLVLPKLNYHEELSGMGGCTPPQVFMCPNAAKELGKAIKDWVKDNADSFFGGLAARILPPRSTQQPS